jgi:hypothetical protein
MPKSQTKNQKENNKNPKNQCNAHPPISRKGLVFLEVGNPQNRRSQLLTSLYEKPLSGLTELIYLFTNV